MQLIKHNITCIKVVNKKSLFKQLNGIITLSFIERQKRDLKYLVQGPICTKKYFGYRVAHHLDTF